MADHGDNYTRMTAEDGSEIGVLGPDCGHHCGVITVGGTDQHIGHCNKKCCHGPATGMETITRVSGRGRVPRVV